MKVICQTNVIKQKRKMLKKFFIIAGLFVFAFILHSETAYSQGKKDGKWSNKTPQERATMRADKMKDNLSLSESQYSQIYNIFLSHFNEAQTMRSLSKEDRQSKREEMKSKRTEMQSKIEQVLSPAQKEKWESLKSERKKQREEKGMKRGDRKMNKNR